MLYGKSWLLSAFAYVYIQAAVSSVLRSATRDRFQVEAALKYCKAFLRTLKGEERRKVINNLVI